jgi:hypothetical protein
VCGHRSLGNNLEIGNVFGLLLELFFGALEELAVPLRCNLLDLFPGLLTRKREAGVLGALRERWQRIVSHLLVDHRADIVGKIEEQPRRWGEIGG